MVSFAAALITLIQGLGQQLAAGDPAAGVVQPQLLQGVAGRGPHKGSQPFHA